MLSNQSAYVDSSEERNTIRWVINQRNEFFQSWLLDQILIFFNYFESIELSWFRTTIISFKVCEIISMQKSIQTRKNIDSWAIKQSQFSISSISFAESNLHIFSKFLNCWTDLNWLYNLRQRKFFIREHLVNVQDKWSINWEIDDFASWMRFDNKKLSLNHLLRWFRKSCQE